MRSRADRLRVERALRIVAIVALAGWIANAARPSLSRRDSVRGATLAGALRRWTLDARVDSAHVQLDTVPDAPSLAWLAALRGAGVGVSWAGRIPALAVETYPSNDPAGGVVVLTSGSPARVIGDALGPVDTAAGAFGSVRLASVEGNVTVADGSQHARADAPSSVRPRRLFVSGGAGWEAKFVIAALEERGWIVDADLFVGPGRDVRQGAAAPLDTARYSAVVLLDSTAVERARGVEQFARAGGGVVLAADANRASQVARLVAWRAGARETAPLGTVAGDTMWRGMSRMSLDSIAGRPAIALERRSGRPVVAARRYYAGRVVGVGYDQTWRWRMSGGVGDSSVSQHRDWWSRVVASVAARRASNVADGVPTGAAPLARLHDVLGPSSQPVRPLPVVLSPGVVSNLLGALLLSALLAEWVLRRKRGAR
jgi:hypothetical protein